MPAEDRFLIEKLAEEFELRKVLDEPISSYSHGMKQKVAIAAAGTGDATLENLFLELTDDLAAAE